MVTEKQTDFIDRSALGIGKANPLAFDKPDYAHGWNCAIEIIQNAPSVLAVELPCRIGDTVWAIRSFHGHKHPQRGIVSEMYFLKDMRLQIVVKYIARGEWGKTIFHTEEEAKRAIGERKDNV